eukprot:g12380.t1
MNMLPHKSIAVLMHRYAVLSGWVSKDSTGDRTSTAQGGASPWTLDEDLKLRNAVEMFGKKWARIARDVLPRRGREALRNRWGHLQERQAIPHGSSTTMNQVVGSHLPLYSPAESFHPISDGVNSSGRSPLRTLDKERGVERSQARTKPTPPRTTFVPTDARKYAEDELSDDPDDCQDGLSVAGQSVEKSGVARDGGVSICSRVSPAKRLFEEDELSDDGCSSVHNGAAVLRRTRA